MRIGFGDSANGCRESKKGLIRIVNGGKIILKGTVGLSQGVVLLVNNSSLVLGDHFRCNYSTTIDCTDENIVFIRGSVFDVAVDLRANSRTYGQWYGVELTEKNKKQFYISEGFAHGFLVLSDMAEFCYKCTDFYHPGDEGGLAWNDPEIGITWPELKGEYNGTASGKGYTLNDGTKLNLSDKDQKWQRLKETFKF